MDCSSNNDDHWWCCVFDCLFWLLRCDQRKFMHGSHRKCCGHSTGKLKTKMWCCVLTKNQTKKKRFFSFRYSFRFCWLPFSWLKLVSESSVTQNTINWKIFWTKDSIKHSTNTNKINKHGNFFNPRLEPNWILVSLKK